MRAREVGPGVWAAAGGVTTDGTTRADRSAAQAMAPWRARQFLGGRALLRSLLAEVVPPVAGADLVPGPNGKPVLAGWPDVGVSISHDEEYVAVGVAAGRRVGVDVQTPPDPVPASMLRRCARRHLDELAVLPPRRRDRVFTEIWAVQEACVKVDGSGIGGRPWRIDVPPDEDEGDWRGVRWRKLPDLADPPVACAWDGGDR
ncbi:4'-phosphopantetheinyl transferase family protein [Micromonospora sp. DT231]|uniref:4'-phosphopantetheinyl transferase family protein n=1 Tax=Micromonospora sp. DT231 TaxID=3416526 RepID=UPI003CF4B99D